MRSRHIPLKKNHSHPPDTGREVRLKINQYALKMAVDSQNRHRGAYDIAYDAMRKNQAAAGLLHAEACNTKSGYK